MRAWPIVSALFDDDDAALANSGGRLCRSEATDEPTNRSMQYPGSDMTGIAGRSEAFVGTRGGAVDSVSGVLRGRSTGSAGRSSSRSPSKFPPSNQPTGTMPHGHTCDRSHTPQQSTMRASCAVAMWMLSNGTILPRFRRVIWDRQQAAGLSVRVDVRGGAHPTANRSGGAARCGGSPERACVLSGGERRGVDFDGRAETIFKRDNAQDVERWERWRRGAR